MLLVIFLVLFACAKGRDLVEPKFQVLTPDELMVEVPNYEDLKLVTFRIGVRRAGQAEDDLELGENDVDNNRVFIYDQRLKLKKGDVVNYLLAFRDKEGYRAQSGNYFFNGVYYKKSFGRRQRFRRDLETTTGLFTTEVFQDNTDDTENFNPVEPRFGHPRHGGHWPNARRPHNFNPWGAGPRHPYPSYPSPAPSYPSFPPSHNRPPTFGSGHNCFDHSHDMCHGRDNERWSNEGSPNFASYNHHDLEYHCKICRSFEHGRNTPNEGDVTTGRPVTTTENAPDIDIRFSD